MWPKIDFWEWEEGEFALNNRSLHRKFTNYFTQEKEKCERG